MLDLFTGPIWTAPLWLLCVPFLLCLALFLALRRLVRDWRHRLDSELAASAKRVEKAEKGTDLLDGRLDDHERILKHHEGSLDVLTAKQQGVALRLDSLTANVTGSYRQHEPLEFAVSYRQHEMRDYELRTYRKIRNAKRKARRKKKAQLERMAKKAQLEAQLEDDAAAQVAIEDAAAQAVSGLFSLPPRWWSYGEVY